MSSVVASEDFKHQLQKVGPPSGQRQRLQGPQGKSSSILSWHGKSERNHQAELGEPAKLDIELSWAQRSFKFTLLSEASTPMVDGMYGNP